MPLKSRNQFWHFYRAIWSVTMKQKSVSDEKINGTPNKMNGIFPAQIKILVWITYLLLFAVRPETWSMSLHSAAKICSQILAFFTRFSSFQWNNVTFLSHHRLAAQILYILIPATNLYTFQNWNSAAIPSRPRLMTTFNQTLKWLLDMRTNKNGPPWRATKLSAVFRWRSSWSTAPAAVVAVVVVPVVTTWSWGSQLRLSSPRKADTHALTHTCTQTATQVTVGVSPAAHKADALPLHPPCMLPGEGTCPAGLHSLKVRRRWHDKLLPWQRLVG